MSAVLTTLDERLAVAGLDVEQALDRLRQARTFRVQLEEARARARGQRVGTPDGPPDSLAADRRRASSPPPSVSSSSRRRRLHSARFTPGSTTGGVDRR